MNKMNKFVTCGIGSIVVFGGANYFNGGLKNPRVEFINFYDIVGARIVSDNWFSQKHKITITSDNPVSFRKYATSETVTVPGKLQQKMYGDIVSFSAKNGYFALYRLNKSRSTYNNIVDEFDSEFKSVKILIDK